MFTFIFAVVLTVVLMTYFHKSLKKQKDKANIKGWVKYQDLDGSGKMFNNHAAGVTCKPDVIEGGIIIEHKSGNGNKGPYESDVLQVGAMMAATGLKKTEIKYADRGYTVKNTFDLKTKVQNAITMMRYHLETQTVPEGAPTKNKCAKCDFGVSCTQSLRVC